MLQTKNNSETKADYELFLSPYERGLLSLLIKKPDLFSSFKQTGNVDFFLFPPHRIIYNALSNLYSSPNIHSIDFQVLSSECTSLNLKNSGVGQDYLMILTEGGSDKENYDYYFSRVQSSYLKHTLAENLRENYSRLVSNAADEENNKSGGELVQETNNSLASLLSFQSGGEEGTLFASFIDAYIEDRKNNPVEVRGLRTGFGQLDKAINGLMPGTLTIFGGVAGGGKSTALLNIADYLAHESKNPMPVLYISTEMSKEEDLSRLIAIRSLYPERGIANGTLLNDPKREAVFQKAFDQIKGGKLIHIYAPQFNAATICNYIYYYKIKYNIGAAIFDYIKLETAGNLRDAREDQILGDLTDSLKQTAGKLGIPVIAGCQINTRSNRVADSDRIIRYCNNLIEIWEQSTEEIEDHGDVHKYGTHWFKIRKARSGPKDWIPIRFWKHCIKMVEAELYRAPDEGDLPRDMLTTPEEYDEIQAKAFSVGVVASVSNTRDLYDLEPEDPNGLI